MPDPRTSPALRQLADIGRDPDPPAWTWAIGRLETCGRLLLSPPARIALGAQAGSVGAVRGLCGPAALVLRPGGRGRAMTVDGRGRLIVPMWLRGGPSPAYLVGTQVDHGTVIIISTTVLETLGEDLIGEHQP